MPFYEYECSNCKFYSEVLQKISDAPLTKCPSCGKKTLKKLISAPNFRLKGGGWYETDFKNDKENKRNLAGGDEDSSSKSESTSSSSASPTSSSDSSKAESKSSPQTGTPSASTAKASASEGSGAAGSRGGSGRRSSPVKPAPAKASKPASR